MVKKVRILVVSDSHGDTSNLLRAFDSEPTALYAFFLGDGAGEFESAASLYGTKMTLKAVRGNCDFGSSLPDCVTERVGGVLLYATHGYKEQVKFGLSTLIFEARSHKAQVALFGHTHEQYYEYTDGLHLFNPGSVRDARYGVLDITPAGIVCVGKRLRF